MRFLLRPYAESDWPALLELWLASWGATRPDIDFSARAPWLADLIDRSRREGAEIVVAEDKQGLLGFALFDPQKNWLEQIAVHPRAFGAGVAQALVGEAKKVCADGFGLEVNADNYRALAFYHCEGFLRTGEGRNSISGLPTFTLFWRPSAP